MNVSDVISLKGTYDTWVAKCYKIQILSQCNLAAASQVCAWAKRHMDVAVGLLNCLCLYQRRVTASQPKDAPFGFPLQVLSHKCKPFSKWILVGPVFHPGLCFGKDQRCVKHRARNGLSSDVFMAESLKWKSQKRKKKMYVFVSCSGYLRPTNEDKIFPMCS